MNAPVLRFRVLPAIPSVDGRLIDLRVGETHLEWRYLEAPGQEATDWQNLIAIEDITGPKGDVGPGSEFRIEAGAIEWRNIGDDNWSELITVDALFDPIIAQAEEQRDFAARWASDPEDGTPIDDGDNPPGQSSYHWSKKSEGFKDLSQAWAESEGQEPGGAGTKSSKEWAGVAEGYANSLNLPPIQPGDAGKMLFVNGGATGYELDDAPAGGGGYDTIADVQAITIPALVGSFRTAGYALAGDGGGGLYKRVGSEPSHAGKIQDASGAWFELVPENGIINPIQLGAAGDGDGAGGGTDDAAVISGIMEAANAIGATEINGLGRIYRIDSSISLDWDDITFVNAKFDMGAWISNGDVFVGGGAIDSAVNLATAAGHGALTINVSDGSSFAAGDWAFLRSNLFWDPDNTNTVGELIYIRSVSGNTLTLGWTVDYRYTPSDMGRVERITPRENITFKNCEFYGSEAVELAAFRPSYVRGFKFYNCKAHNFARRAFGGNGCWNFVVEDCEVFGTSDTTNYAVAFTEGCHYGYVTRLWAHNCRHAVATGGVTLINRHIKVTDSHSVGARDAGFDSHRGADHVDFENCTVSIRGIGTNDGFIVQAARASVINCRATGDLSGAAGIRAQPIVSTVFPDLVREIRVSGCYVRGAAYGVFIDANGTGEIDGLMVTQNRLYSCGEGIRMNARNANIRSFKLNDNIIKLATIHTINIFNNAGLSINRGTINGNTLELANDSDANVRINANTASSITDIAITGNNFLNGTWAVLATNDQRLAIVGNTVASVATGNFSYGGSLSIDANNAA